MQLSITKMTGKIVRCGKTGRNVLRRGEVAMLRLN
jgi:hypothetical protein